MLDKTSKIKLRYFKDGDIFQVEKQKVESIALVEEIGIIQICAEKGLMAIPLQDIESVEYTLN